MFVCTHWDCIQKIHLGVEGLYGLAIHFKEQEEKNAWLAYAQHMPNSKPYDIANRNKKPFDIIVQGYDLMHIFVQRV